MERKFKPETQELIEALKQELQSLTREEFFRLIELSEAGAPCDFKNKQELEAFMKKVKGDKK